MSLVWYHLDTCKKGGFWGGNTNFLGLFFCLFVGFLYFLLFGLFVNQHLAFQGPKQVSFIKLEGKN